MGGLAGVAGGSVIDRFSKPEPTEVLEIDLDDDKAEKPSIIEPIMVPFSSTYADIMSKKGFEPHAPSTTLHLVDKVEEPQINESSTTSVLDADKVTELEVDSLQVETERTTFTQGMQ